MGSLGGTVEDDLAVPIAQISEFHVTSIDNAGSAAVGADDGDEGPADADLVVATRSGDKSAFAELWARHYRSGIAVARSVSPGQDPDDLVQEAYARIYQSILRGGGPTGSFRAYLFTSIRNTAAAWGRSRTDGAMDLLETVEDPSTNEEATDAALDRSLTHNAFRSLPTRWQEVLWYTEIEQMKPADVAPLLGMKATAVAQLAFRAREGLREAWVQAHLRAVADGSECQWTIERLGAHARANLSRRDLRRVEMHLAGCARCTIVSAEAKEVSNRLALVLLPLALGATGATAYLASLQGGGVAVVALAAGAGPIGSAAAGSAAIGGGAASTGASAAGAAGGGLHAASAVAAAIISPSAFGLPAHAETVAAASIDSAADAVLADSSADGGAGGMDAAGILPAGAPSAGSASVTYAGTTPTFSFGLTGEPGATVEVLLGGRVAAATVLDASGAGAAALSPSYGNVNSDARVTLRYRVDEWTGAPRQLRLSDLTDLAPVLAAMKPEAVQVETDPVTNTGSSSPSPSTGADHGSTGSAGSGKGNSNGSSAGANSGNGTGTSGGTGSGSGTGSGNSGKGNSSGNSGAANSGKGNSSGNTTDPATEDGADTKNGNGNPGNNGNAGNSGNGNAGNNGNGNPGNNGNAGNNGKGPAGNNGKSGKSDTSAQGPKAEVADPTSPADPASDQGAVTPAP
jgi:RNA polymerase sigma factor (sigma-70 family)